MSGELFTVGHEWIGQELLLKSLLIYEIDTLVDIRERPQSRKPGFSKTSLSSALASTGTRYLHMRELGTPREIRYRRKLDHDEDLFRTSFLEYLSTQDSAISTLEELASKQRCCLLCFEANPQYCHRSIVAAEMSKRSTSNWTITNIMPNEYD